MRMVESLVGAFAFYTLMAIAFVACIALWTVMLALLVAALQWALS